MEMIWRGLYYFNEACQRCLAHDPVSYLAALENRDLGVIKTIRNLPKQLDFSPYFKTLPGAS